MVLMQVVRELISSFKRFTQYIYNFKHKYVSPILEKFDQTRDEIA